MKNLQKRVALFGRLEKIVLSLQRQKGDFAERMTTFMACKGRFVLTGGQAPCEGHRVRCITESLAQRAGIHCEIPDNIIRGTWLTNYTQAPVPLTT